MRKRILGCALALILGITENGMAGPGVYYDFGIEYIDYGPELEAAVDKLERYDLLWNAGYSFSIPFSIEFEFNTDALINGTAPYYGAGIRYLFGMDQAVRPYVRAGLGWYSLKMDLPLEDVKLAGQGYHFGIGFEYYFKPKMSIGLGMTKRYVTYDHIDSNQYILLRDINGNRIMYGLHFGNYF